MLNPAYGLLPQFAAHRHQPRAPRPAIALTRLPAVLRSGKLYRPVGKVCGARAVARARRGGELLDSAAKLFAANGFAATSVRTVADRARLTKAGLYYHIREKEDLLYRICHHSISAILAGARQAMTEVSDPRARIAALIRNHAEFFRNHPDNLAVLNRDMTALSAEPRAAIRKLERAYLELVRGAISEGQKAGVFRRQLDPTVAAFTMLAALNTLHQWYDPRGRIGHRALVRQITMILCGGVYAPERADEGA